jgi:hypothetical protein
MCFRLKGLWYELKGEVNMRCFSETRDRFRPLRRKVLPLEVASQAAGEGFR